MEWRKVSYTGKCGGQEGENKAHQLLGVEGHLEAMETSPLSKLLWRHLPQSPTDEPLTPRFRELRQFCCFVFSAQTSRLKRELCSAGILPDVIIRQPQMDDCHCVTLSYTTPSPHCWKSMCLPEWKVMVGVGMFSQSSDWHNRKLAKQDLSPQRRWSQVGGFLAMAPRL